VPRLSHHLSGPERSPACSRQWHAISLRRPALCARPRSRNSATHCRQRGSQRSGVWRTAATTPLWSHYRRRRL